MRADPDDRLSLDMFAPATPRAEMPEPKPPMIRASEIKTPKINLPKINLPKIKTPEIEAPEIEASEIRKSSVKRRSAKTDALEQPRALEDPPMSGPATISAEASSESLRPPTYDELWLDPRRAATLRPAPAPARKDRTSAWAGVIAIVMGVMALIALREKIVAVAPPAAKGFAMIGLPVNITGLELRGVRSRIEMDGAHKVLAIEGEIANLRRESTPAPPIMLTVRGDDGQAKYAWTTRAPKSRLEPFETIGFRARLASPPETGADVLVRFANFEETAGRKSGAGVK